MKSIFVSSTYGDLKQERDIAIKAIDSLESAKAIAMERFPADPNPPKEVCLSELRNCDAIVLIFGFAYGSVDADEEISITEIEYNEAKNNNIPVFVFIKQNSEGKWETNEESDDIKEKIKHFKGRIESERWRETFQTPYELAWKISMTLHNYEAENGEIGIKNPQFFKGEEFFRSCSRDNVLFSHIHPLIGRQKIFQDICDFLNSDKQILLIHGRGGIGKSKILFEFYKKIIDESEYKLWFLRDNAQFTADSFRQIPKNKRNVIIVDDAHRQNNLADLLNIISDNRQNIKLILSSRNYGVNYLKSQAIRSGFEPCEIDTLPELDTLKREEMEELADSLLDTDHKIFKESLITVSRDSPLVLVIGAKLINENSINPALLERCEDFQSVVFTRFEDVIIGEFCDQTDRENVKKLVKLISAIQPINPENDDLIKLMSNFIGIEDYELKTILDHFEAAGFLAKKGREMRITPDVLSDYILSKACVTSGGKPTGYSISIFNEFKDVSLQELVSNISECDWRINSDGSEIDIMGQIWTKLFHDFEVGSNYDRTTILKIIEKIAYIQPSKSWELLQYALKNPNEENEEFFGIYCCSHESVLEIIPKVARNISYNVDYLPQCCDLLWHLGKNKTGILHSDPDHPIRILQNITEAGHYSPPIIQTKIIYAIERWLSESNIDDFIHSPLEILDPILQKEAEIVSYNGNVLRLSLFVIGYENTKKIRNKALSIISSLTQDRSIKVVLRAIKSLECALDPPRRLHERDIPDEEYKQWFPEEMMILNIFDELLKRTQNPIIQIQVNKVLKRFEKIGKNEKSRQKAALIRSNIDDSYQVRLARALQYSFDTDFNADYKSKMKELEEQTARVVAEFITNNVNEKEAYQSLCEQIVNFNEADIEYNPGRFFFYLGKEGSDYSIGLCRKILSEPSSPLINNFGPLLSGIKVVKPDIAKQLIREGIESKNQNICNSIAFNYSNGWWGAGNDEDELDFIERLLHSNNREIKKYAIESLKEFPSSLNLRIKEVALGLEITDDFSHADALCGTFFCRSQRMPIILGSDEMEIILEKLLLTRNLRVDTEGNGFYICSFLREVGKTDAGSLVDFLLKRINIALKSHENPWKGYEAIPSTGFSNFIEPVISCPSYQDILRKVRDATFSADKKTYFIRLFEVLSDNYSPNCLEVLEEWIHLRDPDKIFTISQLIQNAKSEFLFMNSDFINKIVEASFNTSPECHEKVLGKLFNIVTSEGRTGILGEPCPLDIQIRDQSMEYAEKYEEGSPTRKFYLELSRQAGHLIEKSLIIDDEAFE